MEHKTTTQKKPLSVFSRCICGAVFFATSDDDNEATYHDHVFNATSENHKRVDIQMIWNCIPFQAEYFYGHFRCLTPPVANRQPVNNVTGD